MSKAQEGKEVDIWKHVGSKSIVGLQVDEQTYRERLAEFFRNLSAVYKAKDDLDGEHKCLVAAKAVMEVETDFLTSKEAIKEKYKD